MPRKQAKPIEELAYHPREAVGIAPPGVLLNLQGLDRDQHRYKLGTLWVWSRRPEEHYLLQASHRKHCHRVQGVFWTTVVASLTRQLIEMGMKPVMGKLDVYMMLREAGIIPVDWRECRSPHCDRRATESSEFCKAHTPRTQQKKRK